MSVRWSERLGMDSMDSKETARGISNLHTRKVNGRRQ